MSKLLNLMLGPSKAEAAPTPAKAPYVPTGLYTVTHAEPPSNIHPEATLPPLHDDLHDDEYRQRVLGHARPVAVMFQSEWCPHSKTFAPCFVELEQRLGERFPFVVLDAAKVRVTCNSLGIITGTNMLVVYRGVILAREDFSTLRGTNEIKRWLETELLAAEDWAAKLPTRPVAPKLPPLPTPPPVAAYDYTDWAIPVTPAPPPRPRGVPLEQEGRVSIYDDDFRQRVLGQPGTMAVILLCEWQPRAQQYVRAFHRVAEVLANRFRFVVINVDKNPMTVITLGLTTSLNILIIHEGRIVAHEDFKWGRSIAEVEEWMKSNLLHAGNP